MGAPRRNPGRNLEKSNLVRFDGKKKRKTSKQQGLGKGTRPHKPNPSQAAMASRPPRARLGKSRLVPTTMIQPIQLVIFGAGGGLERRNPFFLGDRHLTYGWFWGPTAVCKHLGRWSPLHQETYFLGVRDAQKVRDSELSKALHALDRAESGLEEVDRILGYPSGWLFDSELHWFS